MNEFITASEREVSIVKNKLFQSNEAPKRFLDGLNKVGYKFSRIN